MNYRRQRPLGGPIRARSNYWQISVVVTATPRASSRQVSIWRKRPAQDWQHRNEVYRSSYEGGVPSESEEVYLLRSVLAAVEDRLYELEAE